MSMTGGLHTDMKTKALFFNLSSPVKGVQLALSVRFQISVFTAKNPSPLIHYPAWLCLWVAQMTPRLWVEWALSTKTLSWQLHLISRTSDCSSLTPSWVLFTTSRIKHHYRGCACQIWSHAFLVCPANISDIEAPPPAPVHVWTAS